MIECSSYMQLTCRTTLRCVPPMERFLAVWSGPSILPSAIALRLGVVHLSSTTVPKSTVTEQARVKSSPMLTWLARVRLMTGGGT